MDVPNVRGKDREKTLPREAYFSDGYFELQQLFSLSHQINEIHKLRPQSILEIGVGNGFTSSFLRRAGYRVTTADINPALEPDICAPLDQVGSFIGEEKFDLVVCCEVLEHMPLNEFIESLDQLRALGQRLFLTLPNCKTTYGASGLFRIPKIGIKSFDLTFDISRKKKMDKEHFWEVGSQRETEIKSIAFELKARYKSVKIKRIALNPYHIAFICA